MLQLLIAAFELAQNSSIRYEVIAGNIAEPSKANKPQKLSTHLTATREDFQQWKNSNIGIFPLHSHNVIFHTQCHDLRGSWPLPRGLSFLPRMTSLFPS